MEPKNFMNSGEEDGVLDNLFQSWRKACPDPEPGPNFMPDLWGKIDARQRRTALFHRMAASFVTAAMAASLVMAALLALPRSHPSAFYTESYAEALVADHRNVPGESPEPVYLIPAAESVTR